MTSPAVQFASGSDSSDPTFAVAFPSPNTAGNTLVISIFFQGAGTPTVTDSRGNVYGAPVVSASNGGNQVFFWVVLGCKGGANTVTSTLGSGTLQLTVIEYAKSGASGIRQRSTLLASGASNPSISLPTTVSGDICVALFCGSGTSQVAGNIAGSAANVLGHDLSDILTEDGLSTGGTTTCTSTGSTSNWLAVALALGPIQNESLFMGSGTVQ